MPAIPLVNSKTILALIAFTAMLTLSWNRQTEELFMPHESINKLKVVDAPYPATDDEFVGPFPSWINVKTQYGAIGNGIADETAALQAAFDAIGKDNSTASVVYLPAGTYRITGTLKMNFKINVSIIGEDPATTKIKWAGPQSGTMFQINGTAYSRFNRITWDGNSSASAAIDQSWDGSQPHFDTGNEYADNVLTDVGIGIRGGHAGNGFAETAIMRCKFIRNSVAGVSLGNFNALDIWVWHSLFQDCAIGVTNSFGAGNFKVYNSIFRNSTVSDIKIGNTGEFSFRDNTSTNSQAFIVAAFTGNPAPMTIQGNTIIDPIASTAIDIGNQGPITFIDNIIRSRAGATAPIVKNYSWPSSDFFSMGNTFTVAKPLQLDRNIIYDRPAVSRDSLGNLKEQILPGTQPNLSRQIFEVKPGSDAAAIQDVINRAAAVSGTRPIVHLPFGTYNIATTLTIPAGTDLQMVGDGGPYYTILKWAGPASDTVLCILGPSKATLRDFTVDGNGIAVDITAGNIDQPGSRVFMHQLQSRSNQSNLLVNGLDHTIVTAYNSGFAGSSGKSINVIGGQLASSGAAAEGKTIIYAGAESDNSFSHEITNGGNLMIRDVWYESNETGQYLSLDRSGTFTLEGCRVASPNLMPIAQMILTNYSGKAAFLGNTLSDYIAVSGNGSEAKILGLSNISLHSTYFINNTSPSADIQSYNIRTRVNDGTSVTGSYVVDNIGELSENHLATMLEQTRSVHANVLSSLTQGVTDLRFYRLWTTNGLKGIDLEATGSVAGNKTSSTSGFNYKYFEGKWKKLPDFNKLIPVKAGTTPNVDISRRPSGRNDNFAFLWEGYIHIRTPGNYVFETVSDNGSKVYFDEPYSFKGVSLVNNDGEHPPLSASGSVYIDAAGTYPISISFFEKDGGETMELYWTGPGITKHLIPDSVFKQTSDASLNSIRTQANQIVVAQTHEIISQEKMSNENALKVYPNPFLNTFNFDFYNSATKNDIDVDLYDRNGKLVYKYPSANFAAGNTTLKIDVGNARLNDNIYFVRMQINGVPTKIVKIVKHK